MILNEVTKAIFGRQTVREYKPEQISGEQLQTLINAALLAPSGRNSQPCHVRFLQNADMLRGMQIDFKNLVGWDTPVHTRSDKNPFYHNAPTFALIFAEGQSHMDGGIMAENICIAAQGIGLGTCLVGSAGALFNAPEGVKWKLKMNIPGDYVYLIGICIGYPDEKPEQKPRIEDRIQVIR
ncbi:MAG: nitroreductase family protein [Oscillospiraceae bacterium]|nr:nitroreductase family protein [Oscillospiraceae bacterium]